jgi:hypothetical protein
MVQVPAFFSVTTEPFAPPLVRTLVIMLVKGTGRFDDAVALTVIGDSARDTLASTANVMIWSAFDTLNVRVAALAAS